MPHKKRQLGAVTSLVLVFVIGFYAGFTFDERRDNPSGYVPEESNLDLRQYFEIWDTVSSKYVHAEEIDEQEVIYGSIRGLIDSLGDPYSAFMDPDETDIFTSNLDSELEGIGAELTLQEGLLKVVSPLKNSPAERAGLQPGDTIVEIEGKESESFSFLEAIQNIRGPKGTPVQLTVVREGVEDSFVVTITRDSIEMESVTTEEMEDRIFYISINQFSDDTEKEFFEAVRHALLFDAKGIILDLRFNGGGYLDASVDILGEFVEPGQVGVIVESEAAKRREVLETDGSARLADIPLVVLVNEGSASASEILAGALQDYERAILVGEKTFGKGTVQSVDLLDDGSSLRLTIAKWLTPNERDIDHEGITPDLVVNQSEEGDAQLEKAKEYLKNL